MEFTPVGPRAASLSSADEPYAQPNLNISKLKRKMDISGLTLQITAENVFAKGRFYMLWKVVLFSIFLMTFLRPLLVGRQLHRYSSRAVVATRR